MTAGAADIEQIDARWLSDALNYSVHAVRAERVGTGQTGASYRLYLDAECGPSTVLAKVANGTREARQRVAGGYAGEVGFYTLLEPTVDIRVPQCFYAAISDDQSQFTLLLEDLAPRKPGVQALSMSLPQVEGAIRNLAGLHAPRWDDATLHEHEFLPTMQDEARAAFMGDLTRQAVAQFIDHFSSHLTADDVAVMRGAAALVERWATLSNTPFTLLHGDYRPDNLMLGSEPEDVVALDWQTMVIGPPTRDLAYFLGTTLDPEVRRQHESQLVSFYASELRRRGVTAYNNDQCFADYRIGHIQAVIITTVGWAYATGEQTASSDAMFAAMARRSSAALRELETLERVEAAT